MARVEPIPTFKLSGAFVHEGRISQATFRNDIDVTKCHCYRSRSWSVDLHQTTRELLMHLPFPFPATTRI